MDLMSLEFPQRVVVKVGTALVDSAEHRFNYDLAHDLASAVADYRQSGCEIVLVSSGAVGAGRRHMQWETGAQSIIDRQALAAIGQPLLMRFYADVFEQHNLKVAQVLLTRHGLEDRQRYLNATHTLNCLLAMGVVPIINENDTVATEELQFGDNDRLAAVVAGKIKADLLVLFTDVAHVWDENKQPIRRVNEITADLLRAAGGPGSDKSRGGMKSKLRAVEEAMLMGVSAVITTGQEKGMIRRVLEGYQTAFNLEQPLPDDLPGSWFINQQEGIVSRKRWILTCGAAHGRIVIDDGACQALSRGNRSLLPSGIIRVEGDFQRGEAICICSELLEHPIAHGLANLGSEELRAFKGMSTQQVKTHLPGHPKACVAVHHDDMVLFNPDTECPCQQE